MAAAAGPWVGEWRPHRPRGPISGLGEIINFQHRIIEIECKLFIVEFPKISILTIRSRFQVAWSKICTSCCSR